MRKILLILLFYIIPTQIFAKHNPELVLEYDSARPINYGYSFDIKILLKFSNGKTKNITRKKKLSIEVDGAELSRQTIKIPHYPTSFQEDIITIKAKYNHKSKIISNEWKIPYDYRGELIINFSGERGANGSKGSNGNTSMLLRHGKEGDNGLNGEDGENGNDISIYIWKEKDLFFVKVINVKTEKSYFFKANDITSFVKFISNGGNGGSGGDGGNGGNGKNGELKDSKKRNPGSGGNGGNGGDGGTGGKGGNIYIFIHPTAQLIESKIQVFNQGGNGGNGGDAGKGGIAGKPLEGQSQPSNGNPGVPGNGGYGGLQGDVVHIEVLNFNIEEIKK